MEKRKTLGQICFEAMYGPNSGKTWRTYQDCSKEPYERAAAAVEREVLRRMTGTTDLSTPLKVVKPKLKKPKH